MNKITDFLLIFILTVAVNVSYAQNKTSEKTKTSGVPTNNGFNNPLLDKGPDPWALWHDTCYYYVHTMQDKIVLWRTSDVTDLKNAVQKTVWVPDNPSYAKNVWAPEIHYLNGKWYLLFAADDGNTDNHQLYCAENESQDPFEGEFKMKGRVSTDKDNNWAIDGTYLEHNGKLYMFWSGWKTRRVDTETQCIWVAEMENPWTLKSDRVLISEPGFEWERIYKNVDGSEPPYIIYVNEGPQPLKNPKGDKIHMIYSASGCWTPFYQLGMLTLDADKDLLNPANWVKSKQSVFRQAPENEVYGTGHNSFFKSPDGAEDWILYHGRDTQMDPPGAGDTRAPRAQKIDWVDGIPVFGKPVSNATVLQKPSGTNPLPEELVTGKTIFEQGDVAIRYSGTDARKATVAFKQKELLRNLFPAYVKDGKTITPENYTSVTQTSRPIQDVHGQGICFELKYKADELPVLLQRFYVYPSLSYFFTESELVSAEEMEVNYMAPFRADIATDFNRPDTRMLFVPFDNDKWVQFDVLPVRNMLSYEATALFNTKNGSGLVFGSVEHDNWKTGLKTNHTSDALLELTCFGGVTSTLTRDTIPHGVLKGRRIKSPKIMIGFFSDWREGMDEYARANSRIAPSPAWSNGTPFGWNSWGSIQTKINLKNAKEVSDFFKKNLQEQHFSNDNTVYIGLDSYWDNFSDAQLKEFVGYCKQNGQKAGIYWAPFVDWARNPTRLVEGTKIPYKEVYLYANGKPQELDGAWAIDPTHPAVKKRMDYYTGRFRAAGFEYIKIDFVTHGALEADSHFDPAVTTGIQAYNEGMRYMKEALGDSFYITLAISPLFPSQYVHSRRIACDAFASIADTEYTLNGLSYGWWLDNAYCYNDPDHLVLIGKDETEGENRARITSGVITGIYMSGDDFSVDGKALIKSRAEKFLTVPAVNDVARIGRSFRPVYGYKPSAEKRSEQFFMLRHENSVYVAVFNFSDKTESFQIPLDVLGIPAKGSYRAMELWSGEQKIQRKALNCVVNGKDAQLWKIDLK